MTRPGRHTRSAARLAAIAVALLGALTVVSHSGPSPQAEEPAPAAPSVAPVGPSFALRVKAVYPVTTEQPGPIAPGMIIVRNGRIAAIGGDLPVPPDLRLIELRDAVVCPGFVAAASSLAGQHAGEFTVSGAFRAADAFDPYGDYTTTLARGTTTVHLDPGGHRLVSGVGAVVKLAGPPDERTLRSAADLTFNLGVFDPPPVVEPPFYASSDVAIEPARGQRPDSRIGQYLELEERIAAAEGTQGKFDVHARSFAEAWAAKLPMRIQVRRAVDIEGALAFIRRQQRPAYLVGLTEGGRLREALLAANVPSVVRIEQSYRHPGRNIGHHPEALEPKLNTAAELADAHGEGPVRIALAGAEGDRAEDLRMAAILAVRGGMPPQQALAAITRVPAEILGIDERVGSLAPGKDADLLVLTGDPLGISSHVHQAYVGGQLVFEAPASDALVVKAGTVWVGNGTVLHDAAVLIEEGKIQAVGQRVPHPPFARVIDAGADGFLAPGFIDAQSHLGLEGDRTVATPDLPPHWAVAVAGREFERVARAGVTTVLLSPYRSGQNGARVAAVKTSGRGRDEWIARELAGLRFSLRGKDPLTGIKPLRKALAAGKKYDEKWKKYYKELEEWKKQRAAGKEVKPKDETETVVETGEADPITGIWEYSISGGPMPESVSGTMTLKLTGTSIEGRITDPTSGEETSVTGTLEGNDVTLEMDVETPFGAPTIKATIDREDHMTGKVIIGEFEIDMEATRTDKSPVEFKVTRRRKRTKEGRPVPPKLDEKLEPFRPLLAGKIPAVVEVQTAAQINAAIKLFVEEHKLLLVLVGAEDAADVAEKLVAHKDKLGVVVPGSMVRTRTRKPYNQAADLSRRGIRVALQSDSEDGARSLPLMGLYAVQQGLGGDAALRALTIDAAAMYKLDDQLGSLEPGKDADLLVFTGHPFDAGSRLERVIVSGREVPNED